MYYGSSLEDKIIEEYFGSDYIGGCIDVGATNGNDENNTRYFEEKGWNCLCIEPNPNFFPHLKRNRKNAVNYAISNFNKDLIDFTVVTLNNNNECAVSSLNVNEKLLQDHISFNPTFVDVKVSVRTLDYCIENHYKYDKIDFLDIDTEGTELDVLKGLDINRWQPKLIVIENNYNDSIIEEYLKNFNYIKDKRVGVNDYFIKIKKKRFLIGPKLGDFIHSLYAVKCLSDNIKSDVYITNSIGDEKFSNGLENTYKDIYSMVINQPYIDNFLIYGSDVDDLIDLRSFRHNPNNLYKKTWYNIYQQMYNIINKYENQQWLYELNDDNKYNLYKDKIIIHKSLDNYNISFDPYLENILKNNDCIFITSNKLEYDNFIFKHLVELKLCETFIEMYSIIEHCKFFIGNQSAPLSIAHGLFKPHLGFLYKLNGIHYKDNFNENYFWIDSLNRISENFNKIYDIIKMDKMEIIPFQIDIESIKFNINRNINENKIYISSNTKIEVDVFIYEYKINTIKDLLNIRQYYNKLSLYVSSYDINMNWWYTTFTPLNELDCVEIVIVYDDIILRDEIIKIN